MAQTTLQERQPTRVGLTIGSTTRLTEFDFSKISLSLERDLAPAESPLDGFRGIHALLSKALTELQTGPKTQQSSSGTPTLPTSKSPGLTVEALRERLAGWLPDLEITSGFDGFTVKPKRYLGDTWKDVNEVVRSLGGKWQKGIKPADGSWRIPK
jgi:hypothetical protein